ncbi:phospholipid scramblase 1 isoform X2 [Harpegnathos saltator]|uniref:phospholipid scramblase 1 isoform X2 n=1 Tax=Harpegnathos saltator TaxID=610380 RepID=UPI000DBEE27A|nr:phospholipid scramblase 1 isoform X2 [Harpegnathos saltator]
MSNPYAAIYPPAGAAHLETQPIATAPPPGMFPMPQSQPHPNAVVMPQGGWSQPNMTYPSGLEYLMGLNYLFVNQKIELLEAFTGFETKNRYAVTDMTGKPVFYVAEESGICSRLCLGSARPCEFSVLDQNRREVFRMIRPFRCDSCCCPCYLQVKSLDEKHNVGVIQKHWSGFGREIFTDCDQFGVQFPQDLDVKIKAVLLGACFLLDFMYFENRSGFNADC